jgi:hypothetical protein
LAARHSAQPRELVVVRERAVDVSGRDVAGVERVDLVLHQRDERRDDQSHAREKQRGQLIAERLPPPGRHHDDNVLSGQHGFDHAGLPLAEAAETEVSFEC